MATRVTSRSLSAQHLRFTSVYGRALRRHRTWIWFAAGAITLVMLIVLAQQVPVNVFAQWISEWVKSFGPFGPLIYGVAFVLLTMLALPGWPLTFGAGALFGPWLGTLTMSLASTGSAALVFLIGRALAGDRLAEKIKNYPRTRAVYRAIGDGGWKVVAAVRLSHGLPFGVQNFLFGLSPIPFWTYVVTTWLVTLPGISIQVYLGHLAGKLIQKDDPWPADLRWLTWAGFLAVAVAISYLIRFGTKTIRDRIKTELANSGS